LLRLAWLAPGHRALDVATGTGIAAEAASGIVGPMGFVIAADISVPMLDQARQRLSGLPNVSFAVENGQALTFPDANFDSPVQYGADDVPGSREGAVGIPSCSKERRPSCRFR
jgi:ubiquinone/menaquinone biosynthesis C-methylase UbiE